MYNHVKFRTQMLVFCLEVLVEWGCLLMEAALYLRRTFVETSPRALYKGGSRAGLRVGHGRFIAFSMFGRTIVPCPPSRSIPVSVFIHLPIATFLTL